MSFFFGIWNHFFVLKFEKGSVLKGLKNPASTFTILAIIKLFSVNAVFFFQN